MKNIKKDRHDSIQSFKANAPLSTKINQIDRIELHKHDLGWIVATAESNDYRIVELHNVLLDIYSISEDMRIHKIIDEAFKKEEEHKKDWGGY